MPLLANVLITTLRSSYNTSTKVTGAPTAYLTGVRAHAEPMDALVYAGFGDVALSSEYVIHVDAGTDITEQDRIGAIVYLSDGVTAWPRDITAGSTFAFWEIVKATETAPMLLPERILFVKRVRGGGPDHP